jgi:predicted nuclease of predicted toxin-antitoxin system
MVLLADEGVDRSIVERLRQDGHTVPYIAEMEPGISDETILNRANEDRALLLTQDKDFGELVYRLSRIHAGVVLIRLEGLSPDSKAEVVSGAFRDHGGEMLGGFTVISPGRIRIRRTDPLGGPPG